MHKKYGKDGLVIVLVDIDPAVHGKPLPKIQETVRAKIKQFNLEPMTHLILNEDKEVLEQKLRYIGTPWSYVFSREGKWRQFAGEAATDHAAIEALVARLLSKQ